MPALKSRFAPRSGPDVRAGLVHSAQALYAQLREQLKAEILEGRRAPGERLPSEAELTAHYGVSRITVRQALNDLQKEGLLVKAHGKGSFVAQPAVAQDLTRLKGLAESLGGEGRTVHGRVLGLKPGKASAEVAARLGLAKGAPVMQVQTLRYLNREALSLNHSWMPLAIGERLARIDLANRDILSVYENELGLLVHHADLSIGAALATPAQARALALEPGAAVLQVERVVHAPDGTALHYEHTVYRSDLFRYQLTTARGGA